VRAVSGFHKGQLVRHRERCRHGHPSPNAGQRGHVVGWCDHMAQVLWTDGLLRLVFLEELEAADLVPAPAVSDPAPQAEAWSLSI